MAMLSRSIEGRQPADLVSVKLDKVSECAERFLSLREEIERLEHNMDSAAERLMEEMKAAKRLSIKLKGKVVTVKYSPAAEKISVREQRASD